MNKKKRLDDPSLRKLNPNTQIDNVPSVTTAEAKEIALCHGPMPTIPLKKSVFEESPVEDSDVNADDPGAGTKKGMEESAFFSDTIVESNDSQNGSDRRKLQGKAIEPNQNKRPVILLAEEDQDQSAALRMVLETEGFEVEAVFRGDVALSKLADNQYAAAILDWRMAGLPGETVLKVCMEKRNPVGFPIIIVSAYASPQVLKECEGFGAAASFSKPLDIPLLLTRLNQLVRREQLGTKSDAKLVVHQENVHV
jgi:CheY-like chemotaxis protein